ncbi:ubiquinol-cytochrome c reductase iron-sulfur subunit [Pseudomonas sp. CAU 1711]|uniref:ubiquinol-cytochrome c reductase iron-sulfur subunit n=1 Tax=Pseudomonas sp. CAU 1711 TaxID=3140356 RepID=UPI0032604CFF
MNTRNVAFCAFSLLALCLAVNAWVWLLYLGTLWQTQALVSLSDLLHSVGPLKTALTAFVVLLVPALLAGFLLRDRLSMGPRIAIHALLGGVCGLLYLLFLFGQVPLYALQQAALYLAAGSLAGLVNGGVLELAPGAHRPAPDDVSCRRRKLLGSLGLFAGGAGALGSLFGPWQLWKRRNDYLDVDISGLQEGQMMTVELARKPVWIVRRSAQALRLLEEQNPRLLDPLSESSQQPEQARNAHRSLRPEYFIAYGICTHLGCIPEYRAQDSAGQMPSPYPGPQFFCPCHGGVFDLAGRVYQNMPPPRNLEVPEHEFLSAQIVRLHAPSLAQEWRR